MTPGIVCEHVLHGVNTMDMMTQNDTTHWSFMTSSLCGGEGDSQSLTSLRNHRPIRVGAFGVSRVIVLWGDFGTGIGIFQESLS